MHTKCVILLVKEKEKKKKKKKNNLQELDNYAHKVY